MPNELEVIQIFFEYFSFVMSECMFKLYSFVKRDHDSYNKHTSQQAKYFILNKHTSHELDPFKVVMYFLIS
jgi:hypothetical protein